MVIILYAFTDCNLSERLTKIAANPFVDWSYQKTHTVPVKVTVPVAPPVPPMVTIPKDPVIQSSIEPPLVNVDPAQRPGPKRNRKRPFSTLSPETVEMAPEPKLPRDTRPEHVPLQEFYYATMKPDKPNGKENNIVFSFRVSYIFNIEGILYNLNNEKIVNAE